MTGLADTDIKLSDELLLTRATDGDAPVCSGLDCLYQNIVLEAITQPGDLWYDPDFGWGLCDFIQSEVSDLTILELTQRARVNLQKREVIRSDSIEVSVTAKDDVFSLHCRWCFMEGELRELNIAISAIGVEVKAA